VRSPEKIKPVPGKAEISLKRPTKVNSVDERRLLWVRRQISRYT
jgi:hypothetical protein